MQTDGPGSRGRTITDLYLGVMPFVIVILLMIVLLLAFPALATWLPSTMRQ
jgi:TRAP-type mannitol/chloroaromatic compound transport system permease large subunit